MLIDISAFVPAAIMLAAVFLPVLLAVGVVFTLKHAEARDERRSPLKDKLLHQAGAQSRKKAEVLGDEIVARLVWLMLVGPGVLMAILLPRVRWSRIQFGWFEWALIFGALAVIGWIVRDVVRFRRERRVWQNGMRGEIATAQSLDRLQTLDCMVFHDLPGNRGNIDHVVVAPNAVFAVETKWRSKQGSGAKSAEVWFDGKTLQFPNGYRDSAPVEQASACASELAKYLQGKTGERVKVVPVVALPGWYVCSRPEALAADAVAINPKLGYQLLERQGTPIPRAQRNRIINALTERYPELES